MSTVVSPDKSKTRPSKSSKPVAKDVASTSEMDVATTSSEPENRRRFDNLSWWAIGWLTLAHLVVLAAPFTFTWTALAVTIVLHWMAGSLGICLGYHRMLTHTGMKTHPWVRYTFATIGTLAGEGSALDWVADHRKHHAHSDHEGDPHTPHDGGVWSHITWLALSLIHI